MRLWLRVIVGAVVVTGIILGGLIYFDWDRAVPIAALAINYVRYLSAPPGTIDVETAPTQASSEPSRSPSSPTAGGADAEWASYNRTLTSNRFSPLSQINVKNADRLKVLCSYDTGQYTGFTSGLMEVNGALLFSTEYDLFSIDPSTCRQNWRAHEDYTPATPQGVNHAGRSRSPSA